MHALNRLLAAALGLVLLGGGLTTAVEAGLVAWQGRGRWLPLQDWYRTATTTTSDDRRVIVAAAATTLIGIALVIAQTRRAPPRRLPLSADLEPGRWWSVRTCTQRSLATATGATGHGSRVHITTRRGSWRVRIRTDDTGRSVQELRTTVQHALGALHAPDPAGSPIRVRPRRGVRRR